MKKLLPLFRALLGIATVHADTFFVPNTGVNTISQYDENGVASSFTSAFVPGPNGVALDRNGNLFVSTNANTIEEFSAACIDLGTFAATGLNFPMALAFDRAGNLYAANFAGSTVEKFTPAGIGTSSPASSGRPASPSTQAAIFTSQISGTRSNASPLPGHRSAHLRIAA